MTTRQAFILAFTVSNFCSRTQAQTTYTVASFADAFLATGSPTNPEGTNLTGLNFGGAGALFIAPPTSTNGEFQTVMQFDLSGATNLFNAAYGTNGWVVSGLSLQLTGNNGKAGEIPLNTIFPTISGGQFIIEWLSNNSWLEGTGTPITPATNGVTYDSLPTLLSGAHDILCTNTYSPPGDNVAVTYALPLDTNIVNEVMQSGDVSFLLYAADDQISYLFNSYNYGRGNQPLIHVTANATPPTITSEIYTNGSFQLTGLGAAMQQYQIQASTNLGTTNWQSLGVAMADGTGMIQFTDTNTASQSRRFYRLSR
jgi:hypothetical protein